jgi:hypothetical protein
MMDPTHMQPIPDTLARWQAGEITWRRACAALGVDYDRLRELAAEHGALPGIPLREETVQTLAASLSALKLQKPAS